MFSRTFSLKEISLSDFAYSNLKAADSIEKQLILTEIQLIKIGRQLFKLSIISIFIATYHYKRFYSVYFLSILSSEKEFERLVFETAVLQK